MSSVLIHTCNEHDRFDLIAHRYYGTVDEIGRIIDANPQLALSETLTAGTTVLVPIIQKSQAKNTNLPPWFRD